VDECALRTVDGGLELTGGPLKEPVKYSHTYEPTIRLVGFLIGNSNASK
jgi:hypothetical protein